MVDITKNSLRGLVLSAAELQQMTDWPDALIEDYLNLLDNLLLLANEIDTKGNTLYSTTVIVTSPYTPTADDKELFVDTDIGSITISLPAGIDGANYRIINVGSSGNNVIIVPNGTDKLFGVTGGNEYLIDEEVLIMTFETSQGWY